MPAKLQTARPVAGYSGSPLVRKLGLKPNTRAIFLNAPRGYSAYKAPFAKR